MYRHVLLPFHPHTAVFMMLCEKKKQKMHKPTRQKITIYLTKRHSQRRSYELRDRIQQQNRQHKNLGRYAARLPAAGRLLLFWHAPAIGKGWIRKLIAKVKV